MAVTVRDIALATGVSASTVSRALTAPSKVSPATRDRVAEAARRLGYRPNRHAQGLITGRTGVIAVVVPDLANAYFATLTKSVQSRARELGLGTFIADSDEDPTTEVALAQGFIGQVDGIVHASPRSDQNQLRGLAAEIPVVLSNRVIEGIPSVVAADADGAAQLVRHLVALGHREIAWIRGPEHAWSARARSTAIRTTAEGLGAQVHDLGAFAPTFAGGVAAADLAVASGATATIAYNDLVAVGVLERLRGRSLDIPGDMSLAGFDDAPIASMVSPGLTTVAIHPTTLGRIATDLLAHVIDGAHPTAPAPVATELVVRGSTAAPHPRPASHQQHT